MQAACRLGCDTSQRRRGGLLYGVLPVPSCHIRLGLRKHPHLDMRDYAIPRVDDSSHQAVRCCKPRPAYGRLAIRPRSGHQAVNGGLVMRYQVQQ